MLTHRPHASPLRIALVLIAVLLGMQAGAAAQTLTQSGRITFPDGSPVAGFPLLVSISNHMPGFVISNSDGRFAYGVPFGEVYCFVPQPTDPDAWEWISDPTCRTANGQFSDNNFTAVPYPTLHGRMVDAMSEGFTLGGVRVLLDDVAVTTTAADGTYSIRVGDPVGGQPRTGRLTFEKSLYDFGASIPYTATSWADVHLSDTNMYLDLPVAGYGGEGSWDLYDGPGWDSFPLCPQQDVEHNPDLYAFLQFYWGYLSTEIPADRMRLMLTDPGIVGTVGLYANDSVSGVQGDNRVTWSVPIQACGRSEMRVQVAWELAGGGLVWHTVSCLDGGASNLDANGDDVINLADVSTIAAAIGSMEGDPNYDPCVDFNSDGAVNLTDTSFFASHLGHAAAKSSESWEDVAAPEDALTVESRRDGTGSAIAMSLSTGGRWRHVDIVLPAAGFVAEDLTWEPARGFAGEALLLDDADGGIRLLAFSDGWAVDGPLGAVRYPTDPGADPVLDRLQRNKDAVDRQDPLAPEPGVRVWSTRSIGGAPDRPLEVRFRLDHASQVTMRVFDIRGRSVISLADAEQLGEGEHLRVWDGRDHAGRQVSTGTYFARVTIDGTARMQKLVVIR